MVFLDGKRAAAAIFLYNNAYPHMFKCEDFLDLATTFKESSVFFCLCPRNACFI